MFRIKKLLSFQNGKISNTTINSFEIDEMVDIPSDRFYKNAYQPNSIKFKKTTNLSWINKNKSAYNKKQKTKNESANKFG